MKRWIVAFVVVSVLSMGTADGETWRQVQKLLPFDGLDSAFGTSAVALSGTHALVGSERDAQVASDAGAVYTFEYSEGSWRPGQKLTDSTVPAYAHFGASIAADGGHAIVGAGGYGEGSDGSPINVGSAYAYDLVAGNWVETAKLTAADATLGDCFGCSVAIDGNRALIGARSADQAGQDDAGAAYVFELSGGVWSPTAKLLPSDAPGDFGRSVALEGNRAVVLGGNAAHVFEKTGPNWSEVAKLTVYDARGYTELRGPVALKGDRLFVGGLIEMEGAPGNAFVFERTGGTWNEVARLEGRSPFGGFGSAIATDGDWALVGAPNIDLHEQGVGMVEVFSGLHDVQTLAGDEDSFLFGCQVAVDGHTALIGSSGVVGISGAVFVYVVPEPSTLALLIAGTVALTLGWWRRRRLA